MLGVLLVTALLVLVWFPQQVYGWALSDTDTEPRDLESRTGEVPYAITTIFCSSSKSIKKLTESLPGLWDS